jgi:hypothetical protein
MPDVDALGAVILAPGDVLDVVAERLAELAHGEVTGLLVAVENRGQMTGPGELGVECQAAGIRQVQQDVDHSLARAAGPDDRHPLLDLKVHGLVEAHAAQRSDQPGLAELTALLRVRPAPDQGVDALSPRATSCLNADSNCCRAASFCSKRSNAESSFSIPVPSSLSFDFSPSAFSSSPSRRVTAPPGRPSRS